MLPTAEGGAKAQQGVGGDFIIPLLAVAFTLYYFATVWDLSWEAKADGLAIGWALILLVAMLVIRTGVRLARRRATIAADALIFPLHVQARRLALLLALVAFILVLPYLGFTLSTFLFMSASMLILGVRRARPLLAVSSGVAAGGFLLFMVLLETHFPRGLIERLLLSLF